MLTRKGNLDKRKVDYSFYFTDFKEMHKLVKQFKKHNPYPDSFLTHSYDGGGDENGCFITFEKYFSNNNKVHFLSFEFNYDNGIMDYFAYVKGQKRVKIINGILQDLKDNPVN